MGRYPFLASADEYLEKRKAFIAKSTYAEWGRKVKYLNRVLVDLHGQGKLESYNPERMTENDIAAFLTWAREKAIQPATVEKYITLLSNICNYAGNSVIVRMKASGERFPRRTPKDLKCLDQDELEMISEAADKMDGWYGEVAKFLMAIYPYCGLRPSELRLAHIEDLDTKRWRIWVRHPKGEGTYARQRYAPILPPARKAVMEYLEAREARIKQLGVKAAVPLIPAKHSEGIGCYSENRFRSIKAQVMASVPGVKFSLKTFRDTFCQMNIDREPGNLSAVSVAMGHSTTKTTERHYGRMRSDSALDALEKAWELKSISPLIDQRKNLPGYL